LSLGRRIGAVTLLSFAANLAALAKNAAIAARFGVSGSADLVAYAESALLFLPTLLLVRECFGLFVSVYGRLLEKEGADEAASLYAGGLRAVLAIGGFLSLVVLLLPRVLMRWVAPGLPPEQIEMGAWILRWVSPALLLQEVAEFTRTVHNAHHRYAVPGLVMLCGNLLQTALLVSLPADRAMTAWVLAIDAAALMQALLLVAMARGLSRRPASNALFLHPELGRLGRLVAPVAVGVVLIQIAGYIERAVLSYLPPGSLATLAYSRKLIAPLQTVLAASIALPIYVTISRSVRPGGEERGTIFSRGVEINLFLFVPLTILILGLAPEIVDFAFRRGLFAARDVEPTALMLRIGVLAILPASILMLTRDLLYASSRTRPLVLGGLIHLGVTAAANLVLAPRHGIAWIAMGVVAGTWLSCLVLLIAVRTRVSNERWREIGRTGGIVFLGTAAVAAAVRGVRAFFPAGPAADLVHSLRTLIVATLAGFVAYVAVTLLLGHPLARGAIEKLRGRAS
jgi:putative peptidoglycan lipid II flippase